MLAIGNLRRPPGSELAYVIGSGGPAAKRTMCVEQLLESSELEWVLFLDSDMIPEPGMLEQLLALEVPVAAGLYTMRAPPFGLEVGRQGDGAMLVTRSVPTKPYEAEWAGAGALLVRREALEAIEPPYFQYPQGFVFDEDVYFCRKLKAAGYPVLVDPRVQVGHMATVPVTPAMAEGIRSSGGAVLDASVTPVLRNVGD